MKDSFVFYKSFYDAIKKIPEEYQLELYNAILSYSLEGLEPSNLSPIAEAMFILIKPNIDSSQKRYEASVENGKKGGRPKKETQQKPKQNQEETQQKPIENLNEDDDEDDNDIKKKKSKRKTFTPPTLEEIEKYVLEKKLQVDPKKFYDYFTEGNWIDSNGNKVKSWKQKILTWNAYKKEKPKENKNNFEGRQYNPDELNGLYANLGGMK